MGEGGPINRLGLGVCFANVLPGIDLVLLNRPRTTDTALTHGQAKHQIGLRSLLRKRPARNRPLAAQPSTNNRHRVDSRPGQTSDWAQEFASQAQADAWANVLPGIDLLLLNRPRITDTALTHGQAKHQIGLRSLLRKPKLMLGPTSCPE